MYASGRRSKVLLDTGCIARLPPGIGSPDAAIVLKPLHVPSGVGLLPVRTLMTMFVAAGVSLVQVMLFHATGCPASNTRESNVHDDEYGLILTQSREMPPPPTLKSLASGRIAVATEIACEATWITIDEVGDTRRGPLDAVAVRSPASCPLSVCPSMMSRYSCGRTARYPNCPVLNMAQGLAGIVVDTEADVLERVAPNVADELQRAPGRVGPVSADARAIHVNEPATRQSRCHRRSPRA